MLQSIVEVKNFCQDFSSTHKGLDFTNDEWEYIENYLEALTPAKNATIRLQDEQLMLGSYGIWLECKLDTADIPTPLAQQLVKAMENRESQLLENEALLASVYLDPRFFPLLPKKYHSIPVTKLEALWNSLEERNRSSGNRQLNQSGSTGTRDSQTERQSNCTVDGFQSDRLRRALNIAVAAQSMKSSSSSNIRRLLEEFGEAPLFLDPNSDILHFWESKKHVMPQLYQLAIIVHGAPATQVTVERLFSGVRYIYSDLRANLKSKILDDIMVIRCNTQNLNRIQKLRRKAASKRQRPRTDADVPTSETSTPNPMSPVIHEESSIHDFEDITGSFGGSTTNVSSSHVLNFEQM
ncbi:uncharacterized protein LOC114841448 [Diachasma alloeum]|uniref:uncharacterized protein LOC114841448 n=1 Tax=Diachasma alloeum TaxID=454923 RepID=UPI0010FB9EB8|nr:uncharacterized protein LOC114841448 [Diachasma alloeum]